MKKLLYCLSSLTALLFLVSGPVFAESASPQLVSSHPGFFMGNHRPTGISGSVSSENWSGYAVTGANGSFNSVTSSWVQPTVNCSVLPKENSYSAYWIGLDGYSDQTVEQIGTEANCSTNGQTSYYAWYEMYPQNPYEIETNLAVAAGNQLSAVVQYNPASYVTIRGRSRQVSNASYTLTLTNSSTGKSFSTTQVSRYSFDRSSAEVITEAPYSNGILPLSDYGTASYTDSTANNLPLGSFTTGMQDIIMQNPAGMVSTPSVFDSTNKNFSVVWSDSSV
ncbi:MAG TPA: G1 family glutamic endopeptidase [Candidatus Binatia bacterium]|nr:G1 family glutamic endopeptidase [Candidatus Binatia bacterium]